MHVCTYILQIYNTTKTVARVYTCKRVHTCICLLQIFLKENKETNKHKLSYTHTYKLHAHINKIQLYGEIVLTTGCTYMVS